MILHTMWSEAGIIHSCKHLNCNPSPSQSKHIPITAHPYSVRPDRVWEDFQKRGRGTCTVIDPKSPESPIAKDHLRFVCISDTHVQGWFARRCPEGIVPQGDVLLHAGDFTHNGRLSEIECFNSFLESLPHTLKIVIAGNHEAPFDEYFWSKPYGTYIAEIDKELKVRKLSKPHQLLRNCVYLEDSGLNVCGINIYGSPWQPTFSGLGFNICRGEQLLEKWNKIPENTDILMTHTPPLGHGDITRSKRHAGCVELLSTVQDRVKPRYHVFGHIHEGYGVTTNEVTTFINAAICDKHYYPSNSPIVFDFPIPHGHRKEELKKIAYPQTVCEKLARISLV